MDLLKILKNQVDELKEGMSRQLWGTCKSCARDIQTSCDLIEASIKSQEKAARKEKECREETATEALYVTAAILKCCGDCKWQDTRQWHQDELLWCHCPNHPCRCLEYLQGADLVCSQWERASTYEGYNKK